MIGPLLIASLLAYILNPAVTFLRTRLKLGHKSIVLLVYCAFLLSLVLLSISLFPIVVRQAQSLSAEIQRILPQVEERLNEPVSILGYPVLFDPLFEEIRNTVNQFFEPDRIFRLIRSATTNLIWLIIIFVTSYFLLLDWEKFREWLFGQFPETYQGGIRRLHGDIKSIWGAYIRGQLLLMLIVGLISGFTAYLIGLPRAALVGLLAGLLDFIPSIGPAVATGAAAFIAWVEGSTALPISNSWFVILVVSLFTLIQLVENVWLQPSIFGPRVRLHRGIVFVAILGTLMLGSALLALIIVPLLGSARVIGGYLHRHIVQQ
jgi:predicted PurR-regulated permease PerM